MTGSAHITIQINLAVTPLLRSAIQRRIEQLDAHLATTGKYLGITDAEVLLTRDIIASLRRSLAALDDQLPARVAA